MNIQSSRGKTRMARFFLVVFLITIFFSLSASVTSYASDSWRPDDDTVGIYDAPDGQTGAEQAKESAVKSIGGVVLGLLDTVLGAILNPFLIGIGNTVNAVLLTAGISLDSIVYGRVGGMAKMTGGVSLFQFDLTRGNTYGIVTMYIYRGLMYTFFAIFLATVLIRLCRLLFVSNDGKTRSELKSTFGIALLGCTAVFLMPKAVDLILWIKDLVLYGIMYLVGGLVAQIGASVNTVGNVIGTLIYTATNPVNIAISVISKLLGPGGEFSITELYRKAAENGDIFCSLMYIGSTVITIFFAISYITMAFSLGILFVFFPLTCAVDMFSGSAKHMKEWANEVLGIIIIPVIDAVLLIFPIAFGVIGSANAAAGPYTLIQFIMLATIIPTRTAVRKRLGFATQGGLELAGLGALLAVGKLGAAVATSGASLFTKNAALLGLARKKEALAGIAGEKAMANDATGRQAAGQFSRNVNDIYEHANLKDTGYEGFNADKLEEEMTKAGINSSTARNAARSSAIRENLDKAETAKRNAEGMRDTQAKDFDTRIEGLEGKIRDNNKEISRHEMQRSKDKESLEKLNTRERAGQKPGPDVLAQKSALNRKINDENDAISRLNRENGELRSDIGKLRTQKAESNASFGNKIGKLNDIQKAGKEEIQKLKPIGGDTDIAELQNLEDSVTLENYDDPEIRKNLSPEKYQQMAQADAKELKAQAVDNVVGGAGVVRGAALGSGLGSAFGVAGVAAGAAMGMGSGAARSERVAQIRSTARRSAPSPSYRHVNMTAAGAYAQRSNTVSAGGEYIPGEERMRIVDMDTQAPGGGTPAPAAAETVYTAADAPAPRTFTTDTPAGEVLQTIIREHPHEMECINETAFTMGKGKINYYRSEYMNGDYDVTGGTMEDQLAHIGSEAHAEAMADLFMEQEFMNQYHFSNPVAFKKELVTYMQKEAFAPYRSYVYGNPAAGKKDHAEDIRSRLMGAKVG